MTTLTLPKQALQAAIIPESINGEARTVDVVWSTGAKIKFYDWDIGDYYLTLGLGEENVLLEFARSGAPVLDTHKQYMGVDAVKGVIDAIDVDGSTGTATLRFSKRPEVDAIWQDVQDGILRFVSVGTMIHEVEDVSEDDDKIPSYLATLHEPKEISLAPIPKDHGAVMQSEDKPERFPVTVVSQSAQAAHQREGHEMSKTKEGAAPKAANEKATEVVEQTEKTPAATSPAAAPLEAKQADSGEVAKKATEDERRRVVAIGKVAKQAGLGDDFVTLMIEQGTSLDEVRTQALAKLAESDDAVVVRPHVTVGREEMDTVRQSVESALLHRSNPSRFSLEGGGGDFVGMSLLEIGRDLLHRQGVSTRGLPRHRIAEQAMHSTSDFPEILANVAGKTLRLAYTEAPRTFVPWCKQATAVDFKQMSRTQLGEAPNLEIVNESGEFKHGTIGEAAEKYQLATYGKIVGITRQAIVNDDLGAFDRIIPQMGAAAARLESDLVYAILTANPAMGDGTVLFHADHSNVSGAAAAPSVTTVSAGRTAMRKQTGLNGESVLNLMPEFLLVPAAYETAAQQLVASIVAADTDKVNPFSGSLQVIAEPRLDAASATDWYLSAGPNQVDTIEYAYLEGQAGPYIETKNGFDVDGVQIKVRHDFAAKALDHRGLYRNS